MKSHLQVGTETGTIVCQHPLHQVQEHAVVIDWIWITPLQGFVVLMLSNFGSHPYPMLEQENHCPDIQTMGVGQVASEIFVWPKFSDTFF